MAAWTRAWSAPPRATYSEPVWSAPLPGRGRWSASAPWRQVARPVGSPAPPRPARQRAPVSRPPSGCRPPPAGEDSGRRGCTPRAKSTLDSSSSSTSSLFAIWPIRFGPASSPESAHPRRGRLAAWPRLRGRQRRALGTACPAGRADSARGVPLPEIWPGGGAYALGPAVVRPRYGYWRTGTEEVDASLPGVKPTARPALEYTGGPPVSARLTRSPIRRVHVTADNIPLYWSSCAWTPYGTEDRLLD